jgi:hypothetical protein
MALEVLPPPFRNGGRSTVLQFSASQKFTTTDTKTETRTGTITYALQQQIPGLTMQQVTANGTAGVITLKVIVLSSCCCF